MKISKLYYKEKKPIEYLLRCNERNSVLIKRVLANNSCLLKRNNISQKEQIERLRAKGVIISASGISRYKNGVFNACALTYLQIFAEFWNLELVEMITKDFE